MKHNNYAEFTAFGAYCGDFIDCLAKSEIEVWDISGANEIYTAKTAPQNYIRVARKAREFRVKTAVSKRSGKYFLLRRYRKRLGIPAGILAFFAIIVVMSNYIWDIRITGNQQISRAQILEQLEKNGIKTGVPANSFNKNKAEINISLALGDLAWVNIEREGSRLNVKVSESLPSDAAQVPSDAPCNIVAGRSGQIISTEIYRGKLLYPMRSGVNKGDIVVSGVVGNGAGGLQFVHADAKIIAECTETMEFYQPFASYQNVKNGYSAAEKSIIFLGMNFPLSFGSSRSYKGDNIKYTEEIRAPKILGFRLPYRLLTQNYVYYDRVEITDTETDALEKLNMTVDLYEQNLLAGAEIVAREIEYFPDDLGIRAKVSYVFRTDIAVKKEFSAG